MVIYTSDFVEGKNTGKSHQVDNYFKRKYIFSGVMAYRLGQPSLEQLIAQVLGKDAAVFILGVNEAVTNALEHSGADPLAMEVLITVHKILNCWLVVRVKSNGQGFDWVTQIALVKNRIGSLLDSSILDERGRGIGVMIATTDILRYNACGNEVLLAKRIT